MFTIEPRPASAIAEPKTCVATNVPRVFTSSTRMNSSDELASIPPAAASGSGGWSMPALFTRTVGVRMRASTDASASRSLTSATSTPSSERTSTRTTSHPALDRASHQTGPRFPRAPVTTATEPSSPASPVIGRAGQRLLHQLRNQLLEQLEGERHLLGNWVAQRASHQPLELVGGQSISGGLEREILGTQHVACRQVARRDDLLRHLEDRRGLAGVHRLGPVTEREPRAPQVADHLSEAL